MIKVNRYLPIGRMYLVGKGFDEDSVDELYIKASDFYQQLAARDKQLSKAVFLLKEAWNGAEDGEVPRIVKTFLTTIEPDK